MLTDAAYLESLYNNRAAVPDFQRYVDRWADRSSDFCSSLKEQCERDIPYGDDLLETMDVYMPTKAPTAMLMFVHGG
ncbi:MAG: alpha/beta hydrolase, partial [Betaproteobacteria bacterium]|nr:alpha/beta hydrolase [Betaproteobacteria bacterium]